MLKPFEWKDKPALIEHLFPVQKISAESYKEQMAGAGKTLTALGSYWKGRKPLILNKACILGSLLPVTDNRLKDLEIFELLMGMDSESLAVRLGHIKPDDIARRVSGLTTRDYFVPSEYVDLPLQTPFDIKDFPATIIKNGKEELKKTSLRWIDDVPEDTRLGLESKALPYKSFKDNTSAAKRAEQIPEEVHNHIWDRVNNHLGTTASSFPELVEEIGVARFGRRPKVADVFCGSGQIPFEAARLGCDVYASDLNPIACMLTWGAFNIVGASNEKRAEIDEAQKKLAQQVQKEIDELGIETDGNGWRAKAYLYCIEVTCPETGWKVPLIPSLIISRGYGVIGDLIPVPSEKRYDIVVRYVKNKTEIDNAQNGTIRDGELYHSPDGKQFYRTKISSIRGDYKEGNVNMNRLRMWEKNDFTPLPVDIFQERLYCVMWTRLKPNGRGEEYEFRTVTDKDLEQEQTVIDYVGTHLKEWQENGYTPDMVIEKGDETERLYRERGWTHWHHLFNPRQLLIGALYRKRLEAHEYPQFGRFLDYNAKLCMWDSYPGPGRAGKTQHVFYNQALNTFYNYACRGSEWTKEFFTTANFKSFPCPFIKEVNALTAQEIEIENDIYITDPPYGDAVKYEEITEFFIAWLRKNPPKEFADWTWDSRRSVAIKGEDEGFRQGMIAAYRKMAQKMPDNGIQVLMFTHQSGAIWGDMANIIWASGLQVTAAWYVVTETDSALRQGANVKGTVLLVLRKRNKVMETFRDDLGWEIEEAVKEQVESLLALDKKVKEQGAEGLYSDADLQMAGYAAALKVLTAYSRIDGKDMVTEAEAPHQKNKKTFVDELIEFAVQTAVQFLVPVGFEKTEWHKLQPIEKFYLKMAEMEHQGAKTLDNYQNFAKAFKVRNFDQLMSESSKANAARLKLSSEFKGSLMSGDTEISKTPLRALLYALYEVSKEVEVEDVLFHLMENCPNYMPNKSLLAKMADYIAEKREGLKSTKTFKPDVEASAARVLAEAIKNQRL